MRESMGGAFLIKIMIVFIVIYNAILAIAVNYAMAFRVKNRIINLLEEYEGCRPAYDYIENYIATVGYYRANRVGGQGFEITPVEVDSFNGIYYYKVVTYVSFDFPVVGDFLNVQIPGETKTIYGISSSNVECQ